MHNIYNLNSKHLIYSPEFFYPLYYLIKNKIKKYHDKILVLNTSFTSYYKKQNQKTSKQIQSLINVTFLIFLQIYSHKKL